MVTTIKQLVRVEAGGRVAFQSLQLHEGEAAEVIVTVERPDDASPSERLKALNELRRAVDLTPETAKLWIDAARAERAAWRNPVGE